MTEPQTESPKAAVKAAKPSATPAVPADVRAQLKRQEKMNADPAVQKVRAAVRAQGDMARAASKKAPAPNTERFKRREYTAGGELVERSKR